MADRHGADWRRTAVALGAALALLTACSGSGSATDTATTLPAPTTVDREVGAPGNDDETIASGSSVDAPDDSVVTGEPVTNGDGEPIEGAEDLGALGETPVRIEDGDESIEIGIGDLPVALAEGFPLPDDFAVDVASEEGDTLGVTGTTALDVPDATAFYQSALTSNGFEIVDSDTVPDVFATFAFDGPSGAGQVAVSETPGNAGSTIVITID